MWPGQLARQPASQPARPGQFEEDHQALDEQQQSDEDRKRQFKWAVYKFMCTEKQGMNTKYFKFEELKNSIFLSNFSEDHLKYWIKKSTEFLLDHILNLVPISDKEHHGSYKNSA